MSAKEFSTSSKESVGLKSLKKSNISAAFLVTAGNDKDKNIWGEAQLGLNFEISCLEIRE